MRDELHTTERSRVKLNVTGYSGCPVIRWWFSIVMDGGCDKVVGRSKVEWRQFHKDEGIPFSFLSLKFFYPDFYVRQGFLLVAFFFV